MVLCLSLWVSGGAQEEPRGGQEGPRSAQEEVKKMLVDWGVPQAVVDRHRTAPSNIGTIVEFVESRNDIGLILTQSRYRAGESRNRDGS